MTLPHIAERYAHIPRTQVARGMATWYGTEERHLAADTAPLRPRFVLQLPWTQLARRSSNVCRVSRPNGRNSHEKAALCAGGRSRILASGDGARQPDAG